VTIPFSFEGKMRNEQAQIGIRRLRKHVDSLVVINNNKLREVYGNLGFKAGFSKADEVLSTAATGIAEVITHHYTQNIDLRDAKTVLSNSGTAIMGSAQASGSNRAQNAITKALDSPLLNDNKIEGSKNVLLLIVSGTSEVTIDEIGEINDYIQSEAKTNVDIIMGVGEDESLGDAIAVTIIATGFNPEQQNEISKLEAKKIVHRLEEDRSTPQVVKRVEPPKVEEEKETRVVHTLEMDETDSIQVEYETVSPEASPATETTRYADESPYVAETPSEEETPTSEATPTAEATPIKEIYTGSFETAPVKEEDIDFEITNMTVREPEIVEPMEEESENQFSFTFDLPIQKSKKEPSPARTLEKININDIEIVGLEHIIPEPFRRSNPVHNTDEEVVRHSLEEEFAPEINALKSASEDENEDENLNFELKVKQSEPVENDVAKAINDDNDISPLNLTIAELKDRAELRRKKMKDFNYKFINKLNHSIDEIESQPAYKRMGVDLREVPPSSEADNNKSRMSLGTDENDDIQLRSNNSFLHDNVD
jgi:cell division protein FtsZ